MEGRGEAKGGDPVYTGTIHDESKMSHDPLGDWPAGTLGLSSVLLMYVNGQGESDLHLQPIYLYTTTQITNK